MSKYAEAIRYREELLEKWKVDPPANWSPEYLAENKVAVQKQIDSFKAEE